MKTSMYKLILLAGITFSGAALLSSCSKADAIDSISSSSSSASAAAKPSPANGIFNHELVVTMAKDDGVDITSNFNGITFYFTQVDAASGPADAWNDLLNVHGTWGMADQVISFSYPTNILSQLAFLNKQWQISTVVGPNGTVILTAVNENDILQFSNK